MNAAIADRRGPAYKQLGYGQSLRNVPGSSPVRLAEGKDQAGRGSCPIENDALLRCRYRRALRTAGLPPVRFHDLRHMFGSTAVKTFALSDVQAMLGHAHITTTTRYVHHRPGADDAARLAAALDGDSVSPVSPTASQTGDLRGN